SSPTTPRRSSAVAPDAGFAPERSARPRHRSPGARGGGACGPSGVGSMMPGHGEGRPSVSAGPSGRQGPGDPEGASRERGSRRAGAVASPMDPFVAQLHALGRAGPTRAKWVFVPGHNLGHPLGERLALEGTSWANLRFPPPLELALWMAAPFLVDAGVEPATDGLGPALVTRLLLDLPRATPAYFRPLAEQPRMAEA